jgi:O-antigen/teichoic acid export membrane protein
MSMSPTSNRTFVLGSKKDLKGKAVRGAGISTVGQLAGFVCHIAGVIIMARLLSPEDFGLVMMVTAINLWLVNFGANGFPEYMIQKRDISHEEVSSLFWLHLAIAVALAAGFAAMGPVLVAFYDQPLLDGVAKALSIGIILSALGTHHLGILKREMRFTQVAAAHLIAVVASTGLGIAAAVYGMGYWSIVVRQLSVVGVSMVVVWILCSWRPGRPRNLSLALPGLKYASYVYGNYSFSYCVRNIDKVLLGRWHGAWLLGQYDRAYHLSNLPASQLLSPLHSVALATLSRIKDDHERFCRYYLKAVSTLALVGALAALLLVTAARDLIQLLLGPSWGEAGRLLMALGPGVCAFMVYETYTWLHLSLATPERWLRWNIFSTVLTVGAFLWGVQYGAMGMAVAYSSVKFGLMVPGIWYASRPVSLSMARFIQAIWVPFAAALTVAAVWALTLHFGYWSFAGPSATFLDLGRNVVVVAASAALLYVGVVLLFARSLKPLRDMRELANLVLKKGERKPAG